MGQTGLKELKGANQPLVLVVDDDQAISSLIRNNLVHAGIKIIQATTGSDCIRILGEKKVDLILLDIRLPDLSGWDILSLLRLTEPLCNIPVIVVSVEPPDTALIERFQPEAYVQKPIDIRDLLVRINEFIGSKNTS